MAGIAFGYGDLSKADAEAARLAGDPVPGNTAVLELTYLFQITPFASIQPDVQFHFNPAGDGTVDDAVVVGSRFSVDF